MAMQWCIDLRATQQGEPQEPVDCFMNIPAQLQVVLDALHETDPEEQVPIDVIIRALELLHHDAEQAVLELLERAAVSSVMDGVSHTLM
jgi:hypothetical protein